jgi:hypothetical protein
LAHYPLSDFDPTSGAELVPVAQSYSALRAGNLNASFQVQDRYGYLFKINITHFNSECFRYSAAQARKQPDEQPVTLASGGLFHEFYLR